MDNLCGLKLRTVLMNLGIEHRDLAKKAGVSVCNLSRFLRGERRPSAETKRKLAESLRQLIHEDNLL